MEQNEFADGEKVFAKEDGHPHWPAKILEIIGDGDDAEYRIMYFGSKKEATLKYFQLFNCSNKTKRKYRRMYKRIQGYTEALAEMNASRAEIPIPEVDLVKRGNEYEDQEEIIVDWTTRRFKKHYYTAKRDEEVIIAKKNFSAGEKFGAANWWEIALQQSNEDLEIHLRVIQPAKPVFAKYSVSLKTSAGRFSTTMNVPLRKYKRGMTSSVCRSWKTLEELQNDGCLPKGRLHLRLALTLCAPPTKANMTMGLLTDFKNGLNSDVGSDVVFKFPDEEGSKNIKAHKAILSLRSSAFAAVFGDGMREMDGEVRIYDISSKAMRIILNFIYSGEVDEEWGSVAEEIIYGAEKYELAQLELFWSSNVSKILTVENVMKIRSVASRRNLRDVLKSTMKFIKNNTKDFVENHEIAFKRKQS